MGRVKRIWYLSPMRAAKVQASLRIRAVSPEPPLLAHISSEPRGTFRQKAWSLAPLNGWACAVKICYDGMLEDADSLDAAHIMKPRNLLSQIPKRCVISTSALEYKIHWQLKVQLAAFFQIGTSQIILLYNYLLVHLSKRYHHNL